MNSSRAKDLVFQGWEIPKSIADTFRNSLGILHKHIILVLTILFALCLTVIFFHISQLKTQMVTAVAFRGADIYTRAVNEMRNWYTEEVVQRLHGHGVTASTQYREHPGEIPLPVDLSRTIGERLVYGASGQQIRLISPFPFGPQPTSGGVRDPFQREAWDMLNQHPEQTFLPN